jgi:hypothetical protein
MSCCSEQDITNALMVLTACFIRQRRPTLVIGFYGDARAASSSKLSETGAILRAHLGRSQNMGKKSADRFGAHSDRATTCRKSAFFPPHSMYRPPWQTSSYRPCFWDHFELSSEIFSMPCFLVALLFLVSLRAGVMLMLAGSRPVGRLRRLTYEHLAQSSSQVVMRDNAVYYATYIKPAREMVSYYTNASQGCFVTPCHPRRCVCSWGHVHSSIL